MRRRFLAAVGGTAVAVVGFAGFAVATHEVGTGEVVYDPPPVTIPYTYPVPDPVTVTETETITETVTVTEPAPSSGWETVVNDGFSGTDLDPAVWFKYRYQYATGSCPAPEHVTVSGGMLRLLMKYEATKPAGATCNYGAGWYPAGVRLLKEAPLAAVDQRITLRWRAVSTGGVVSHRILPMRWPADLPNNVHGEEDWCEGHEVGQCRTFLHWLNGTVVGTATSPVYNVDLSQWHVMRMERIGYLHRFYIDDLTTPVWEYVGTEATTPTRPRILVLQQECKPVGAGGCPAGTSGQEEIQVDWVVVENWTG